MSDYYMEVSIRKQDGRWVVLTVLPSGNVEHKTLELSDALGIAAKEFARESLRHGQHSINS